MKSTTGVQVEIMHLLMIFMQAHSAFQMGGFLPLKGNSLGNTAGDTVRGIAHDLHYGKIISAFLLLR